MPRRSAEDRADLALALVLWRYVGHTAGCTLADQERRDRALRLASSVGVSKQFLDKLLAVDVLAISVKNLDSPPPRSKRGHYRRKAA